VRRRPRRQPRSRPPLQDLPVVGESEAAAFRAFGEWHEFSNGTRGKIDLIDVQLPADPDYPKQYPARQALQVRMTVDNPTGETIGNAVNMGPRFATRAENVEIILGRSTPDVEMPRLIRPGQQAVVKQHYGAPDGVTVNPGDEFTVSMRMPLFFGQQPTMTADEWAEWIGVPVKGAP
jgi:hypothetical protein